ncbi:hypothetical protein PLESTB_000098500 [Pleodorina starrii]|uniref:Channelopsin 1 n=1 Tax=Pleodorina starrii TaxID=330485 RepID=A0A9W6BA78_9CHLO|nr:hypothetical protein PLESTB_000098500 [Pleodorina starrii]GLC71765.1 hypothetical protein PLESTF_001164200 [Pleodorina starrii]
MDHPVPRSLMATTYADPFNNGSIIIPSDECFCMKWIKSKGAPMEKKAANALQWAAFAFSVAVLVYYAYATWKTTCGWEEVYVCCIELTKVVIEFFHEFDEPSMLYLANGNRVLWLRYGEWLLTCPVILIHLSNLTGLSDDYNKRTMRLLVSDIGTIVWGATSAMSSGYVKVIFFLMGVLYGANTFFHAAKVYIEAYHTVPKGLCRQLVRVMAWLFFVSWGMFPVMFLLGPEGFDHLSIYGSTIGHTVIDLMSKTCWGLLGHFLRLKIHEHILLYGDIRKVQKIKVAGQELEVETMMTEEGQDTVKKSTGHLANRESFLNMRDKLKEKGFEVRASLDNSAVAAAVAAGGAAAYLQGPKGGTDLSKFDGGGGGVADAAALVPGRVILAVPDISMVDYFREQFAQLPVPYEVVPALGADNAVQLVLQASQLGGCDFVLLHPEFLRDKGPGNLLARLRTMGQRAAAFGWSVMGPVRDLIESAGLDGWLEGPSFGNGISMNNLIGLVVRMQQARRMAAMMGLVNGGGFGQVGGGMMMGAGNGMGMMGGGGMMGGMAGVIPQMSASGRVLGGVAMGGGGGGMMGNVSQGGGAMHISGNGTGPSFQLGSNPLYNTVPSPLSSQPGDQAGGGGAAGGGMSMGGMGMGGMNAGMMQQQQQQQAGAGSIRNSCAMGGVGGVQMQHMGSMGGGVGGVASAAAAVMPAMAAASGGGAAASEAEMLQQLMAEINRLKSELGE